MGCGASVSPLKQSMSLLRIIFNKKVDLSKLQEYLNQQRSLNAECIEDNVMKTSFIDRSPVWDGANPKICFEYSCDIRHPVLYTVTIEYNRNKVKDLITNASIAKKMKTCLENSDFFDSTPLSSEEEALFEKSLRKIEEDSDKLFFIEMDEKIFKVEMNKVFNHLYHNYSKKQILGEVFSIIDSEYDEKYSRTQFSNDDEWDGFVLTVYFEHECGMCLYITVQCPEESTYTAHEIRSMVMGKCGHFINEERSKSMSLKSADGRRMSKSAHNSEKDRSRKSIGSRSVSGSSMDSEY